LQAINLSGGSAAPRPETPDAVPWYVRPADGGADRGTSHPLSSLFGMMTAGIAVMTHSAQSHKSRTSSLRDTPLATFEP
jgi:hypothetical protein